MVFDKIRQFKEEIKKDLAFNKKVSQIKKETYKQFKAEAKIDAQNKRLEEAKKLAKSKAFEDSNKPSYSSKVGSRLSTIALNIGKKLQSNAEQSRKEGNIIPMFRGMNTVNTQPNNNNKKQIKKVIYYK